jgi:hypothetical protein
MSKKPKSPNLDDAGKVVKLNIAKPAGFLEKFRSRQAPTIGGVEVLLTALPHYRISDARDFVRLHPSEDEFWSPELCFVTVPIKGAKRDMLHLIDEDIAMRHLPARKVERFRLALATKPHDVFFLAHVPSQNLDNAWNLTALDGCEKAKARWLQLTSRKEEGVEAYKISFSHDVDAFPEPNWPKRSLDELLQITFASATIETDDHPALLRLIGAKQNLK